MSVEQGDLKTLRAEQCLAARWYKENVNNIESNQYWLASDLTADGFSFVAYDPVSDATFVPFSKMLEILPDTLSKEKRLEAYQRTAKVARFRVIFYLNGKIKDLEERLERFEPFKDWESHKESYSQTASKLRALNKLSNLYASSRNLM